MGFEDFFSGTDWMNLSPFANDQSFATDVFFDTGTGQFVTPQDVFLGSLVQQGDLSLFGPSETGNPIFQAVRDLNATPGSNSLMGPFNLVDTTGASMDGITGPLPGQFFTTDQQGNIVALGSDPDRIPRQPLFDDAGNSIGFNPSFPPLPSLSLPGSIHNSLASSAEALRRAAQEGVRATGSLGDRDFQIPGLNVFQRPETPKPDQIAAVKPVEFSGTTPTITPFQPMTVGTGTPIPQPARGLETVLGNPPDPFAETRSRMVIPGGR